MNILHFTHSFFPVVGGTTTRLFNLLSESENTHYLYVPYPLGASIPVIDNLSYGNIKVRRYKNNIFKKISNPISFVGGILNRLYLISCKSSLLSKIVKENNIEISHGHNPTILGLAALKFAKKRRIPFIYEAHLFEADKPIMKTKKFIPYFIYRAKRDFFLVIEKQLYTRADKIIAQTERIKKRMIRIFKIKPTKIKVIPMGIDGNFFDPIKHEKSGMKLRMDKNWNNKIIFMYNGFLKEYNGISLFLESILTLPESLKEKIKVVILGRGPLKHMVEKFSIENPQLIEFIGLIDYNLMPVYYSAVDVVVNPRLATYKVIDNIPTKILEGMAMEKVVLGSNINSIKGIVQDNLNGILFESGNIIDLSKRIAFIINNFRNLIKIRKRARKDIIHRFDWKLMRQKLNTIYREI